jgi:hypothetical protein
VFSFVLHCCPLFRLLLGVCNRYVVAFESCSSTLHCGYSYYVPESIISISSPTNHSIHSATPAAVPLSLAAPILRPQIFNIVHIVCGIFPHFSALHSCFVPFFEPIPALLLASHRRFLSEFILNPHTWHQSGR